MDDNQLHAVNEANNEERMPQSFKISEILSAVSKDFPSRIALVFLEDGEDKAVELDYRTLHQRAMAVAADLSRRGLCGERVLLLLPSGIEYVAAFLGCLYAGAIAVPVYPPKNNWHANRVRVIAQDAGAAAALTLFELAGDIRASLLDLKAGAPESVIAVDRVDFGQAGFVNEDIAADGLAYLQYTSGSTGNPKGVMVRHGDLLKNCALYCAALGLKNGETLVSWLPIFHDMGLVQGIVMPLSLGGTAVFMPPAAMVQKPARWLRAISRYRAVFSGAPNFAYEMCVAKVSQEELAALDLSCWRAALNAAEPISPSTVSRFGRKFLDAGLRPDALIGGFGLAEATLYVTCGTGGEASPALSVDKRALERDEVAIVSPQQPGRQVLISSGRLGSDPRVCIVNPETRTRCAETRIGEIWVSGSSVCGGYWQLPDETEDTFGARLSGDDERRHMRTGDLGFVHDGQLYVTGRLKDLIIIRGANHYPQDLEASAEQSHPALRKGGWGAAFTLEDEAQAPQLVVVHEVERTVRRSVDVNEVGMAVMQAITEQHGIDVHVVVLVEPGGVPKTSSGKIQRKPCKTLMLSGQLNEIGRWRRAAAQEQQSAKASGGLRDRSALEALLRELVARLGAVPAGSIAPRQPFSALGLNSLKLVEMVAELGSALGMDLAPTVAFEYPTIERLAGYLSGDAAERQTVRGEQSDPVAVVGMSCRFPGADGPEEFWELLKQGKSAVCEITPERRALTGFQAGPGDAFRWGGFLSNIDGFDAALFGISPREAQSMDPQQRLLLETTWHALESAGIAPNRLAGTATGVFMGISSNDYFRLQRESGAGLDTYSGTGSAFSIAANRISYCLGLQGPSMALDTACSSSLVAVHQACRSLEAGESDLAVAGGVNLVLSPDYGHIFSEAKMLSPSGRCHTFGDGADGYVRGEGCGAVVLKRLSDALRDGDRIHAVIRGSAVNQDGPSNGLTAPNGQAQQDVIRSALRRAGLAADAIGYVETHGTGTPLGDPIEISALKNVLDVAADDRAAPCWLGAVKPNIGHLEPAAGIAGLIKTILVLKHAQIPPVAMDGKQNPRIDLTGSRLRIARELNAWSGNSDDANRPRYAGVSSFGFGGANAHLILESAPPVVEQSAAALDRNGAAAALLLTLSANNATSLRRIAQRYAALIEASDPAVAVEICHAANAGAIFSERLAVAASEPGQIVEALAGYAEHRESDVPRIRHGRALQDRRVAFLFTGQGSQHAGMGRLLYREHAVFRAFVDRCDTILQPHIGHSICDILFGDQTGLLDDTRYAQPALVVLELALAELWRHYGVTAQLVCGHSVGEYAAACVAGLFDLDTALRLVALRGRLMSAAPGQGAMLSVAAAETDVMGVLAEAGSVLEIAAVNAPDQIVLAGTVEQIELADTLFARRGIGVSRLKVSHAFHSHLMEPILDEFQAALATVAFHPMSARMIPCCDGPDAKLDRPDYWIWQLRRAVRFDDAIGTLIEAGAETCIEVGPMPVLSRLGARAAADKKWIASMRKDGDERLHFFNALGEAFVAGAEFRRDAWKLPMLNATPILPLYEFDRKKYWFSPGTATRGSNGAADASIAGRRLDIAVEDIACFETMVPNDTIAYVEDHKVRSHAVMPGADYANLILTAAKEAGISIDGAPLALRNLTFLRPLDLTHGKVRLQTVLQRRRPEEIDGTTSSSWLARVLAWDPEGESWESYASGKLLCSQELQLAARIPSATLKGILQDVAQFYADWHARGLEYGVRFQALRDLALHGDKVSAMLVLPQHVEASHSLGILHPVLLDAAFQAVGALIRERSEYHGLAPLPTGIDELIVFGAGARVLYLEAQLNLESTPTRVVAELSLYDEKGSHIAQVRGLRLRMVSLDVIVGSMRAINSDAIAATATVAPQYLHTQWTSAPPAGAPAGAGAKLWLALTEAASDIRLQLPYTPRFHRLADDFGDLRLLDRSLGDRAVPISDAVGLLVWLEPDQPDADAVERCLLLCRQLRQVILTLANIAGLPPNFKLCLVTHGAATLDDAPMTGLAQAGAAAMLRSAALEYPGLRLMHIDLAEMPDRADLQQFGAALASSDESQIAIRGGQLLSPRLHTMPIPAAAGQPGIRNDGAYLVTGGGGGIGLALADWLANAGARRIVLVSRRAANAQCASLIGQWQDRGVDIVLAQADLSRAAEVDALFATLNAAALPLRGIFHAAGVLRDGPLQKLSELDWLEAMNAKAKSALLLDRCSRRFELDYFVMFSSIAASFGSAGQCNYAAANGLIDALAARRAQQGLCAASINWGPWAEIGMASDPALAQRLLRQGLMPMQPSAALQALGQALERNDTQAAIAAVDWPRFIGGLPVATVPSLLRGIAPQQGAETAPATGLISLEALGALDSAAAGLAIRQTLAGLLRQVLRSDESGPLAEGSDPREVRLSSLGVDSLMATELRNRVRAWVNVDLPAHLLIGNSSVEEVADLVYQKILLGYLSLTPQGTEIGDGEEFVL